MNRILMIFLIMMLTKITSFSENILIPNETDSIVHVTASDLKYANLIFAEHNKLLIENSLLTRQIDNLNELNFDLEQIVKLRSQQVIEYRNLNEVNSIKIERLNKELKKAKTNIKYWQIGGITVSVGLILFLLLK